MILSDGEIRERLVADQDEIEAMKGHWARDEWNKIDKRLVIDPLDVRKIGPCSYDLSIGDEYLSLRDPHNPRKLSEGEALEVSPGEAVLILTKEYICLPRDVMGLVVPRARLIREGTLLNATRVDPSWYGKLIIGFANHAKFPVRVYSHDPFCTCVFVRLSEEVKETVAQRRMEGLGRTTLRSLSFTHAIPTMPLGPEQVTREMLQEVVETYGKPWDIIRGAIEQSKKEIINYIDRETAPNMAREAADLVIKELLSETQRMNRILIVLLGGFVFTIIGYLTSVAVGLLRLPAQ